MGRGHRIMPHELNHRAKSTPLRSLGVRWIICITAVAASRTIPAAPHRLPPNLDRTSRRWSIPSRRWDVRTSPLPDHISADLRHIIARAGATAGYTVHNAAPM